MGCCQSTQHSREDTPPPHPVNGDGDGNSTSPVLGHSTSRVSSSRAPYSPRPGASSTRSRRRSRSEHETPLAEHFNKPLIPHAWDGKHKFTRSLPGPNARRQVWSRRSLDHEREVFFETQTTGAQEIWGTLRLATELLRQGDIGTAQSAIDAAEVTVPYGDIAHGVFDSQGQFYQMPEWAIADPPEITEIDSQGEESKSEKESDDSEERRVAKGKGVMRASETFEVRARMSDRGGPGADITIELEQSDTIKTLAKRVKEEAGLQPHQLVRIAYLGQLLRETSTLHNQGWKHPNMVNALVSG